MAAHNKINDLYSILKNWFSIWCSDISFKYKQICNRAGINREPVVSHDILVCIHEWGGYKQKRRKSIKGINDFECGLKFQLERFNNQILDSKWSKMINLTISDIDKFDYKCLLNNKIDAIHGVDNMGMDFSGYSFFYELIKNRSNSYVILTNSSVNKIQTDFLQGYIDYMENNPDVGILGISASSKYYHTLRRWNFNPHLQSFFLLTTIDVLNKIVNSNNGIFPGKFELNKHLLIRNGEVMLSQLAIRIGFNLAIVRDNGEVIKFNNQSYPLPTGDLRKYIKSPNSINPII